MYLLILKLTHGISPSYGIDPEYTALDTSNIQQISETKKSFLINIFLCRFFVLYLNDGTRNARFRSSGDCVRER